MALLLVLLCTILAFSLASTEQCVSSPGSSVDLTLHSHKNASGDWIITVKTRRLTVEDDPRQMSVDVHHETKMCERKQIEQLITVALVHPSLDNTSLPGATEPSTIIPTATPPITTTATPTTAPKSCPSGYQLYPEFNCYKAFPSISEERTWSEARDQCVRDGGNLMVMETEQERNDVYLPLLNSLEFLHFPWMGVYIPEGEDGWMTVNGEPARSTWWSPGQPVKDALWKCAYAYYDGLLRNFNCAAIQPFICEISL